MLPEMGGKIEKITRGDVWIQNSFTSNNITDEKWNVVVKLSYYV